MDLKEAQAWLTKAADGGDETAQKLLKELKD
jgi:hypothetical protein